MYITVTMVTIEICNLPWESPWSHVDIALAPRVVLAVDSVSPLEVGPNDDVSIADAALVDVNFAPASAWHTL